MIQIRRSDLTRIEHAFWWAFEAQRFGGEATADGDVCCICMETGGGVWWTSTVCAHRLHMACAGQWIQQQPRCPVCRAEFRPRMSY